MKNLINAALSVIAFFLILRVFFLFFSINQATPFVSWILSVSSFLMAPFANIVPNLNVTTGVVDMVALITLLIYSLAGYLLISLLYNLAEPEIIEKEHEAVAHYHDIKLEENSKPTKHLS